MVYQTSDPTGIYMPILVKQSRFMIVNRSQFIHGFFFEDIVHYTFYIFWVIIRYTQGLIYICL